MEVSLTKVLPYLEESHILNREELNLGNPPFEESELKVLVQFLGVFSTKFISLTVDFMNAVFHKLREKTKGKVFMDFAYQFSPSSQKFLYSKGVPLAFGWSSKRTVDEFDVVLLSISIHYETPLVYDFWFSTEPAISPFHKVRLSDDRAPFVMAGGVVADHLDVTYHPEGAGMDLVFMGEGEVLLFEILRDTLYFHRRESIKRNKFKVLKSLMEKYPNLYYPDGYKFEYSSKFRVESITKLHDFLPDKVEFHRVYPSCVKETEQIENFSKSVYTNSDRSSLSGELKIANGCSGFLCTFCHEGSVAGSWREYSLEYIRKELKELRRNIAPNSLSFFSFNNIFHSSFLDLYVSTSEDFLGLSWTGFRGDVVAKVPGILQFMRIFKIIRQTIALEGISHRVREGFLNKNLSWDLFFKLLSNFFKYRVGNIKIYLIQTGYEEEEDFEEFIAVLKRIKELKTKMGANTGVFFTVTTLIHYWQTPVGLTARKSIYDLWKIFRFKKNKDNPWIKVWSIMGELGFFVKVNSGPRYIAQQLFVDYGKPLAGTVYDWRKEEFQGIRQGTVKLLERFKVLNDRMQAVLMREGDFEDFGDVFLNFPSSIGELNPSSVFEFFTPQYKKLRFGKFMGKPTPYCTPTPANLGQKCKGCNLCPPSHIKELGERTIISEESAKQACFKALKQIHSNRVFCRKSFVFYVPPEKRFVNKLVSLHALVAQAIRKDSHFSDSYFCVTDYCEGKASQGFSDSWSGFMVAGLGFRKKVDNFEALLPVVKTLDEKAVVLHPFSIRGGKLVSFWKIKGNLGIDLSSVLYLSSQKKVKAVKGRKTKEFYESEEVQDVKAFFRDGYLYLAVSYDVNPLLFLGFMFKIAESKFVASFDARRIGIFLQRGGDACVKCGKMTHFDLVTSKVVDCFDCLFGV